MSQVVWNYPNGDFAYFNGLISEVSYGYEWLITNHLWKEKKKWQILLRLTDKVLELRDLLEKNMEIMRCKEDEPFEYWIGKFMPENTIVPDGFDYVDFPNIELGVCWVYGKEEEVYCLEDKCADRLKEDGFEVVLDEKGAWWFFERYCCSRFDIPDDKGNIILDICHFIK